MIRKGCSADPLPDLIPNASLPQGGSARGFVLTLAFVFLAIGCWPLFGGASARLWSLTIAAVLLVISFTAPGLFEPLRKAWLQFGLLLGRIISPIVLLVIYCVAVVPTALLMRVVNKDPLQRTFDACAQTYWITRVPAGRPDHTMKNPF